MELLVTLGSILVVRLSLWKYIKKIINELSPLLNIYTLLPSIGSIGAGYYYNKLHNEWFFYFFILTILLLIVLSYIVYKYNKLSSEKRILQQKNAMLNKSAFFTVTYYPLPSSNEYDIIINIEKSTLNQLAGKKYNLKSNKFTILSNELIECIDNLKLNSDPSDSTLEYKPINITDAYFKFRIKHHTSNNPEFYIKIIYMDPLVSCNDPTRSLNAEAIIYPVKL